MNDSLVSTLIGAFSAIVGIYFSDFLTRKRERKEKSREAKSKIISSVVIQFRNLEKGMGFLIEINMNKYIIVAISKGLLPNSPWTIDQLEFANNSMAEEVVSTFNENNLLDIELVHNLGLLQAFEPKSANLISDSINRYIVMQTKEIILTEKEAFPLIGNPEWKTYSETMRNNTLSALKILHNDIVTKLGSENLKR